MADAARERGHVSTCAAARSTGRAFDAPYARQRVSAPTYAFAGKEYWARDLAASDGHGATDARRSRRGRARPIRTSSSGASGGTRCDVEARSPGPPDHWVIFADQRGVGAELAECSASDGIGTTLVVPGRAFKADGSATVSDRSVESRATSTASGPR